MNGSLTIRLILIGIAFFASPSSWGIEADAPLSAEEQRHEDQVEQVKSDDPRLIAELKEKYKLSDEQIKELQDKNLKATQALRIGALAFESGKPVSEIFKMRFESKMGWGRIAKELGVHPSVLGKSVSSFNNHNNNDEKVGESRESHKNDSREEKFENKETRRERRLENKAERLAIRAERAAKKLEKSKSHDR